VTFAVLKSALPVAELDVKRSTSLGVLDTASFVHTAHQLMVRLASVWNVEIASVDRKFLREPTQP
jgi:hypothetical protein